ncbi:MAG: hypothetical protein ACYC1Z_01595 [Georgenia sp.]
MAGPGIARVRRNAAARLGDIGEEDEEIEVVPMPREVPVPEPMTEPAPEEVPA